MEEKQNLQDLVERAVVRHDTSVRQLGFMAQERGYKVTGTTIGHIRAGTYKYTPTRDTLAALAWLAGVHEDRAFIAAGLPIPGPPLADELPPGVDNLSPRARRIIIDLARHLVDVESKEVVGNEDSTAPITRAGESPATKVQPRSTPNKAR